MNRSSEARVIPIWTLVLTGCVVVGVLSAAMTRATLLWGLPVLAAGAVVALSAARAQSDSLHADGPYAVVRHPLYLGLLLMLAGAVVALGSLWGAAMLLPAVLVTVWRARAEENDLLRHYGDRYRHYQERVPFFLPRLGRKGGSR